ncbi:hypothetical protein N7535_009581 [Penicillium sp. DV-2018c]|nr:hypothetical protein N7461_002066 [Penicillium sp. DV-2018c]KAJ5559353.1 hypothetical protein N7535_009581 [Penicillium sp. DV-2018c]
MKPLKVLLSALHIHRPSSISKSKPKPKPNLANGRIPPEILDMIQEYLDLPDQICFALTCKHLYIHLTSYRKANGILTFNTTLPRKDRFPLRTNTDLSNDPRIQLLRQLQDKTWQYCFSCQILHHRTAKKHPHPPCYNGINTHKHCNPSTGIVDLCPCLSITPTDRQLVAACIEERTELHITDRVFKSGFFRPEWDNTITHSCTVGTYPGADMDIVTEPYRDRHVGRLGRGFRSFYVQNTYAVTFRDGLSAELGAICPEEEPYAWLRQFFKEAGLEYSAWAGEVKQAIAAPGFVKIVTDRELGWKNRGMRYWVRNRNDRS